MKKIIFYISTVAMMLTLSGCNKKNKDSVEPEVPTYSVKLDSTFNHVAVEGLKESYKEGDAVALTVTPTDDFVFFDEKVKAFKGSPDGEEIIIDWLAVNDAERFTFKMPSTDVYLVASVKDPIYNIVLDKYTHMSGGDIEIEGVEFHFDEKSVIEDPEDGFVRFGAYGSICLENYVPGIEKIYVECNYDGGLDEGYLIGVSSTPNSVEKYEFTMTTGLLTMNTNQPYFIISNQYEKELTIKSIRLVHTGVDEEKELKELVEVNDQEYSFDANNPIKPYEINPIDESKIPENRIVRKIEPLQYDAPGEYVYGYEVYSKIDDNPGKLLYSSTANFVVKGTEDNKHVAVFHLPNKVATIPVGENERVDMSLNSDIKTYNWISDTNDFISPFHGDRHYYPVYSVVGVPSEKDGDGCYPITTNYSALEKTITMPDPVMKEGYLFGGWFMDPECNTPFDPDGAYDGNITLYAKCIETTQSFRKVYYYDYNGAFLSRVDYLPEDEDASIDLPTFDEIETTLVPQGELDIRFYELRMGANRVAMLRPKGMYPVQEEEYPGDKLTYASIREYAGDIKLIVSKGRIYDTAIATFTRFFSDLEQYTVASGFPMGETYAEGDYILTGRYVSWDPDWHMTYNTYYDPQRCDTFAVTDAVDGYIIDQGSYNSISSYGYGNKHSMHSKPLHGIIRHDSVIQVQRRAFFNRYGLTGTYFPKNAREFDVESYAKTHFNGDLLLPKSLSKISARAFMGSSNIHRVFLPKTLREVGQGAFSLGDYNEESYVFENIRYRSHLDEKILFYYEGSQTEFNKLSEATRTEIMANASNIVFNVDYTPYYGR